MSIPYIYPDTRVHADFGSAEKFLDKDGIWVREEPVTVDVLAGERRAVVVGEPGVGKTLMMQKLLQQTERGGAFARLLSLRETELASQVDEFIGIKPPIKALFLDGLDEVRANDLPRVLKKIHAVSTKNPELALFISSRWIFIRKYSQYFPNFRFISISPFSHDQVRKYLTVAGQSEDYIETLINRLSFSHRDIVIQIPRYLCYLTEYLEEKGITAAARVSRNDLFEYFIYRKLELEEQKLSTEKRALTKRILEKLALVMEIYQANVISKDELMTIFDDIKSDLTAVALAQLPLENLFNFSLLKNNIDSVEFENTEFQEYLAAKEITRFPDPGRATFEFAADPAAKEIYPIWVNTLTFLVDMLPQILEPLIEFSGIRSQGFKIVDETFWKFLSRVDTAQLSPQKRHQLFGDVNGYQRRTRQWLPGDIAAGMSAFYDASLEDNLKQWKTEGESAVASTRFVLLGNLCYVLGHIFRQKKSLDKEYWRKPLIVWASDHNDNGVLQRHALFALGQMHDPTVIDDLPDLTGDDSLIAQEFISMCAKVAPDHPKCLSYFVEAVKLGNFYGRDGILALRKKHSVASLFMLLTEDTAFRHKLLDRESSFRDPESAFWVNVESMFDPELVELGTKLLAACALDDFGLRIQRFKIIRGLWRVLRRAYPEFISKIMFNVRKGEPNHVPFWTEEFFARVLETPDIPGFLKWCVENGERRFAFGTMSHIFYSDRSDGNDIYESGRTVLIEEYRVADEQKEKQQSLANAQAGGVEILNEFRTLLEPEPGKYSPTVFHYFNEHLGQLKPLLTPNDTERLVTLLRDSIFQWIDPSKYDLTITSEEAGSTTYTTADVVQIFRDALDTARHLKIELTEFRQKIIDFIPFAYHDDLEAIFELVADATEAEMKLVLEVYEKAKSDLWRHQPLSFVNSVERYRIVGAVPVLKSFVYENKFDKFCRVKSLTVLDSLFPDQVFLQDVFNTFRESSDPTERALTEETNRLLITSHSLPEAIAWRFAEIIKRAAPFVESMDIHIIEGLEEEIRHKSFAQPLMKLASYNLEDKFLKLIDKSLDLWEKGSGFQAYAQYLWEIAFAYFDNRRSEGSYSPLQTLQRRIDSLSHKEGANWLATRMLELRRSYLTHLGKPQNIGGAIGRYNEARIRQDRKIHNSADLFTNLLDAFDRDIRKWIEGEGAYAIITAEKIYKSRKQEYEKLVQKTIKAQIENILLKRGFQVEVLREPELYDEKRIDFLVRYGFAGPVIVEIKLTSNNDIRGRKIEKSPSYKSMRRYMDGFGAAYGMFLVLDNTNAKNIPDIKRAFETIPAVSVLVFECAPSSANSDSKKAKEKPKVRMRKWR
jgi:hypothetical protein